ncbi:MAG TPA: lytic transglycosylase domain-containing protein [Acidimicrobiia bacterium]|nr:lytic transglycosylase domain-containing protein [Acidimicrobiia bacterium]
MRRAALVLALVVAVGCSGGGGGGKGKPVNGPEDIPVPSDAAQAAASLARVERALRAPKTRPTEINRLGREQQNAYRALSVHPRWLEDVVARLPADVQPIVTANERAGRDLQALGGKGPRPRQLPDWHIVSPLPVEVLRAYYGEAEAASGIPWAYLASIHLVETRLGRIRGTSSAGAQGPMQFIPETWARYGQGDINDNYDAILAAARLLQANGGPGDMGRALLRYNNSNRYVDAVESYAQLMLSDERAFLGYYQWQVYSATTDGTFVLPEGYPDKPARKVSRPPG